MPGAGRSLWINKRGTSMRGRKRVRAKLATVATVKKMIRSNEEKKAIDVAIDDGTPQEGTSVVTLLTGTAEGDDNDDRDGREIRLTSIQMRGIVEDTSAVGDDHVCRLLLIRWNELTDGSNPAVSDILKTDNVAALRNRDKQRSFQVVWDKTFILRATEVANGNHKKVFNLYKRWKTPRRIDYTGTGATIAHAGKGHYFLVRMHDAGALAINWELNLRLTFMG